MQHCNLEEFAGGALSAQVNNSMARVVENIANPNTDPKKPRKIIVTITMKANSSRTFIAAGVETKVQLAPEIEAKTMMKFDQYPLFGEGYINPDEDTLPGQMQMDI